MSKIVPESRDFLSRACRRDNSAIEFGHSAHHIKAMATLPKKLKVDAILEAVFEIRFVTSTIPEVFVGRVADAIAWKGFEQKRLPITAIPEIIRNADETLRYQPLISLEEGSGNRSVKIGPRAMVFHNMAPYVGWSSFQPQIEQMIDVLFEKGDDLKLHRLGLRYVNVLTAEHHGIGDIVDLNLSVNVDGAPIKCFNLNLSRNFDPDVAGTVRITSPDHLEGPPPEGATAVIDIDVFTPQRLSIDGAEGVKRWVSRAHEVEKIMFFELLTNKTIEALREE